MLLRLRQAQRGHASTIQGNGTGTDKHTKNWVRLLKMQTLTIFARPTSWPPFTSGKQEWGLPNPSAFYIIRQVKVRIREPFINFTLFMEGGYVGVRWHCQKLCTFLMWGRFRSRSDAHEGLRSGLAGTNRVNRITKIRFHHSFYV